MPAGAVSWPKLDVGACFSFPVYGARLRAAPLGGPARRRILAIPSVLQAASYRAARRPRKAPVAEILHEILDLARSLL